ncbi:MAG TPA: cytochrome C [Candidatus Desulfofervidus auxilii]|uniref:Cytochrome C n=1 Tax=Desulfofervidus auxilii TaxID=1621989 RepID=A0A7C2A540_DESA2|nr:cytochrome C [Candidatus Desulfofervidus auxilii]
MKRYVFIFLGILFAILSSKVLWSKDVKKYVGSEACKECHETEYNNFMKYAKKPKSYESIAKMRKGLTESEIEGCYKCHTTGYGRPSGFISPERTPNLRNASCEVCHGPGSVHVESGDPADIKGKLDIKDCEACHVAERVEAFEYKPLIYGGAH